MRSVIRMFSIAFATLLLSLLVFATQSVQAATLTVSTTADGGAGSLRQALIDATTNAAANTIVFNIPLTDPGYNSTTDRFTITLVNQLPNIPLAPLTIDNTTGRGMTVKGDGTFRIFTLVNSAVVNINNLKISQGGVNGGLGGGIYMGDSSTLFLRNCLVTNNTATNGGGGIWMNNSATLHVIDSTISDNTATTGDGGGIRINDSGTLNITGSTVSGNTATVAGGGGIYNGVSGTVNATNITVTGNTAGARGGGLHNAATTTVSSSTFSGNAAASGGGGIYNSFTATVNNSLIAHNTGADGPDLLGRGSLGAPFTGNNNLIGNADGSEAFGPTTNQLGTTGSPINARLGPLQDNGGLTFTQALLAGSPAIDAGATALATDQRGVSRPQNGDGLAGAQSDIGSFESEGLPEITINDVTLAEPANGSSSAMFTVSLSRVHTVAVSVDFATTDGTALAGSDYVAANGTLTFAPGETAKTVTVTVNGDLVAESGETFTVDLTNVQGGARVPDSQGLGTIGDTTGVPTPTPTPSPTPTPTPSPTPSPTPTPTPSPTPTPTPSPSPTPTPIGFQLNASSYTIGEGGGSLQLTVTRPDTSVAGTVSYATSDTAALNECDFFNGVASSRCDYATSIRILRFAIGEGSKTTFIPIVDDSYAEGDESFNITLSNPTGATLGTTTTATITIQDNETVTGLINPLNDVDFFIRQQYIDFLGREPEPAGLAGWRNTLVSCPASGIDANGNFCDRIEVSAGFFRSEEFQTRGYFVYRFQSAVAHIPLYNEFMPDFAQVSGFLSSSELEANKVEFVDAFISRAEFQARNNGSMNNPTLYVDDLLQTVGLPNHPGKSGWVTGLTNSSLTRAQVLRELVESPSVNLKYNDEAFVIMQYFGYLRRTADAQYLLWINTMNTTGGDYRIMIGGFLNSLEYRKRFGPN